MRVTLKGTVPGTVLSVGILLCGALTSAFAQVTSGSVAGTVKDIQGGIIPGATVTLISDTKQTKSNPVVTNAAGDFVFGSVPPDTYTVQVEMPSFKTLKRSGIQVSPGTRSNAGTLTIDVGGTSEVVDVKGEAPQIQASSAERSFAVSTAQLENLPLGRTYLQYAALTPGVDGTNRSGGGGGNNYMLDGVVVMDPGSGTPGLSTNIETVAEVKVLTSGYQAEYGRASGLQITAVTKSGTNNFRGSAYDVERNSNWNSNSHTNVLNGDPKTVSKQRDFGFSIGGPVGKPGGRNKLFFFFAQEVNPRSQGNDVVRFRFPTALERQGDFSKTLDQNGALYPDIKDPRLSGACSATSQVACFAAGGVLGRIPTDQLYSTGLAILNWWPLPNIADASGLAYNYQLTRPLEAALGYQPALKVDYQPSQSLRVGVKYAAYGQRAQTFLGQLPGFTDARPSKMIVPTYVATASYTLTPTTFMEATFGHTHEQQESCSFTGVGNLGPAYCTGSIAMAPIANYKTAGFGDLPLLYPNAQVFDPAYRYISILEQLNAPQWDGTRAWRAPTFAFGNRIANAPPAPPWPGFFQSGGTVDLSTSVTKVMGRHTFKGGYYYQHELHYRNGGPGNSNGTLSFANDTVGTNPFDTSFGYANTAIGAYSSYSQVSKNLEGRFVYNQNDFFIQDNWKIKPKLTLDYGVRLVHQQPYMDRRRQGSNFFPDQWKLSAAPVMYVAGCANGVSPCTGTNRQAFNPLTGQFLGPTSAFAIGTLVPNSGSTTNGTVLWGNGISNTGFNWPALGVAPRFGMAYDARGNQKLVFRGGAGLYFDRPSGNAQGTYGAIGGPGVTDTATVRFGQLQTLASGNTLTTLAPNAVQMMQYNAPLPASVQFNAGLQIVLPWATALDVEYVGQHSYDLASSLNINAIDMGNAFLASAQDTTTAASATPGASSLAALNPDLVRSFQGYNSITYRSYELSRTYHSLQLSFNRRFRNGFSFGFNDTIGISDKGSLTPRITHGATPGTYAPTSDDAQYQELLGNNNPTKHILKGNFIWDLPDLKSSHSALRVIGLVVNDWQLSGVWTGATGMAYVTSFSYASGGSSVNLTGSPDYAARIRIIGDPGAGCGSDLYRQFTTAAFAGPLVGSRGLESGNSYLHGCFTSTLDLSIARNIRFGGSKNIQLRLDMFNAPNSAIITGRNTTLQLSNPNDPLTNTAPVFDPVTGLLNNGVNLTSTGALSPNRTLPKNAGFGVANAYQAPRSLQAQIRFSF
jgi:Carboxypeptidase regulatory-like domain